MPNVIPTGGTGGPGYTIQDEPVTATTSAARSRWPGPPRRTRVGSQFFIVLDDKAEAGLASANTYQIIGEVTSGMDVVDAIAAMPTAARADKPPWTRVAMTKVTVTTP